MLETSIAARDELVRRVIRETAEAHPKVLDAEGKAWLNAFWEWIHFHLPRLDLHFACHLARKSVQELAQRVERGGRPGAGPRVPDAVRAVWEGKSNESGKEVV